ncbi:hypothetical protein DFH29DRAFT_996996 [Suillus ampliporus]|nr:hypothetical protein DFH29DRAFT_996996 [Suillus ampliporus]
MSHEVWIAAGRLLEQEVMGDTNEPEEKHSGRLTRTVQLGVRELRREQWRTVRMEVEEGDKPYTCVIYAESAEKAHGTKESLDAVSITSWVLARKLEEPDGQRIKACALLENGKGRLDNPANEFLWAESVSVEERSGEAARAKVMLTHGLQECLSSGLLWSMST